MVDDFNKDQSGGIGAQPPIWVWVSLLIIAGSLFPEATAADTPSPRPNIVFVLADDLGWGDVSFHGGNAPTPHLDRLASEGLELTQHYVAPVCSPTRIGFLTGRYWSRFGVTTPTNERALPWDTVTLASALKRAGYDTCLIGKWHLGSRPQWGPNHYGFDHCYGSLAGGVTPWSHFYKKGPYSVTWHRNGELLEETGHVTDLLADEAVKWIGTRRETPFFLYVPFTAVHLPLNEPQPWLAKVPASITGEVARHYAACIMHLDDSVGRILEALDDAGLHDNTLVVFTSDNGGSTAQNNTQPYPDDNCPDGKLTANNAPFRGQKGTIYEGGTRVPTVVSWPGRIRPGQVKLPLSIVDWMPTFCALAGYQPERDLKWDGANLSAALLDAAELFERPIYIAGPRWRARSLRLGNWKLVVIGDGDKRTVELFDISADPEEANNLASQHPQRLQVMLKQLGKAASSDRDAVVQK